MASLENNQNIELPNTQTKEIVNDIIDIVSNKNDDSDSVNDMKVDYRLNYFYFQWFFIIFFTLIAVIDRYTLNMWPLWVDSPGPTIPGNFSVSVFSVIAWISSRILIVSSSYIFLFQTRIFWNWFGELKIVNKYFKIGDIMHDNIKLHFQVGWILIGIPVCLHVWAIVFAAAFEQNSVVLYDSWMRPFNPDTGKNIPFYADNLLSLGINDVYRITSTSITFFILIPYSIVTFFRNWNWSFAQWIHLLGAIIYTVDLIRMKSHPHCWVFNVPFILWWMCDRLYGIFGYRRCVATVVSKRRLDDDYLVLYLRINDELHSLANVGDVFYFNLLDCQFDRSHPFTTFQNHGFTRPYLTQGKDSINFDWAGHKFTIRETEDLENNINIHHAYQMSRDSTILTQVAIDRVFQEEELDKEEEEEDNQGLPAADCDWNLGVLMQIHSDRVVACNSYKRNSWTRKIEQSNQRFVCGLRCWGPYRSEYRLLMKEEEMTRYPETEVVLIGTGAGSAYMVDYFLYVTANNIQLDNKVTMYFTARSIAMFQWFTDVTCKKHYGNLFVNAHLTSHPNITYHKKAKLKSRDSNIGRLSFTEILNIASPNTHVFFCGNPTVQEAVQTLCKSLKLRFHKGHSFH